LGTILTIVYSLQEESKEQIVVKECSPSFGAEYLNILFSIFLSKDIKINVCRALILPFVLYGCETWPLTLRRKVG
jgi:hypothetical protein